LITGIHEYGVDKSIHKISSVFASQMLKAEEDGVEAITAKKKGMRDSGNRRKQKWKMKNGRNGR
jgi:hypothetical protein